MNAMIYGKSQNRPHRTASPMKCAKTFETRFNFEEEKNEWCEGDLLGKSFFKGKKSAGDGGEIDPFNPQFTKC